MEPEIYPDKPRVLQSTEGERHPENRNPVYEACTLAGRLTNENGDIERMRGRFELVEMVA